MKSRALTVLLGSMIALVGFTANGLAQTKSYTLPTSPERLLVSHAIDVEIIPSDRNQMVVEVEDGRFEEFKYTFRDGKLTLSRAKKGLRRILRGLDIEVKLYVADISKLARIDASGASDIEIKNRPTLQLHTVSLSGASDFKAKGTLNSLKVELSGASDFEFEGSANNLHIDASGASDADMQGNISELLSVDLSGASSMDYEGRVREARIDVSGASDFDGKGAVAEVASLDASGASHIRLRANQYSKKRTSGMSVIN